MPCGCPQIDRGTVRGIKVRPWPHRTARLIHFTANVNVGQLLMTLLASFENADSLPSLS
jgi:hypothetical protein